jgi:hypothetical protein
MQHQLQPTAPIHFLHIGKTGGSALKHALARTGISRVVLHEHSVTLADVPPGESVFFFVRNPVTRFVSGFFSRQRQGQPRYFSPWSEREAIAFGRFGSPNELALGLASSTSEERAAAIVAMNDIEHVRDSYWRWLGSPTSLLARSADILFIGQQEHLQSDCVILAEHLNVRGLELPDDEVAAHRNPAHLDTSFSPGAVDNLTHWYRQEFDAINVCIQVAQQRGFGGSLAVGHRSGSRPRSTVVREK